MAALHDLPDAIDDDPAQVRTVLLDQLRHLIDEVEALKGVVDQVPATIRTGRPTPDALSMKEVYGALAARDAQVRRPRLKRIAEANAPPAFAPVDDGELVADDDWNAMPMEALLDRVQAARAALVEQLEALPAAAWERTGRFGDETQTVYAMVHRIVREDTTRLRDLGYRLHEANLTDRERDLPK